MANVHPPLDICQGLKQMGFPQDNCDYYYYADLTGSFEPQPRHVSCETCGPYAPFWASRTDFDLKVACPPVLTADGRGGVLAWLEHVHDWHWERSGVVSNKPYRLFHSFRWNAEVRDNDLLDALRDVIAYWRAHRDDSD